MSGPEATVDQDLGRPPVVVVAAPGSGRGLAGELEERGLLVVPSDPDGATRVACAVAPDLVVVDGSVPVSVAKHMLRELRVHPVGRGLAVLWVGADAPPSAEGLAFGVVDVLLGQPLPTEVADHALAAMAQRRAGGVVRGKVTTAELPELVASLGDEARTGVFAVFEERGGVADTVPLAPPVVLSDGRDVTSGLAPSSPSVPRPGGTEQPILQWAFLERPAGSIVSVVGASPHLEGGPAPTAVLAAGPVASRRLAAALAAGGIDPVDVVASATPGWETSLRLRDPSVLVLDRALLTPAGYPALRRLTLASRLVGATWVVADPELVDASSLVGAVDAASAQDRWLLELLERGEPFHLRLEAFGAGRLLRLLAACTHLVGARFEGAGGEASLDLGAGRIQGGQTRAPGQTAPTGGGADALAAVLRRSVGRVAVERLRRPARVDLGGRVEALLGDGSGARPAGSRASVSPRRRPARPVSPGPRRLATWASAAGALIGLVAYLRAPGAPEVAAAPDTPDPTVVGGPPSVVAVDPTPPPDGAESAMTVREVVAELGGERVGRAIASPPRLHAGAVGLAGTIRDRRARMARHLGAEAAERRDWAKAEWWSRRALGYLPDDPALTRDLSLAIFRQRRVVEAIPWVRRAVVLAPDDPRGWTLLGDTLGAKRDVVGAQRAWSRALEVGPGHRPASRRLDRLGVDVEGLLAEL